MPTNPPAADEPDLHPVPDVEPSATLNTPPLLLTVQCEIVPLYRAPHTPPAIADCPLTSVSDDPEPFPTANAPLIFNSRLSITAPSAFNPQTIPVTNGLFVSGVLITPPFEFVAFTFKLPFQSIFKFLILPRLTPTNIPA